MAERNVDATRWMVLSLKPRFAEEILAGTKTIEVRRVKPRIHLPTQALLYASGGTRALVGTCVVERADLYLVDDLWEQHGDATALTRSEFDAYLQGRDSGVALTLTQPKPLETPKPLHLLRQKLSFRPPQSLAYMTPELSTQMLAV